MAGTIVADDLQHSTAGSVGTEYVVNGSAKAWVNFNGTGTVAIRAGLNTSSITDRSTGKYTITATSALADTNYAVVGGTSTATSGGDVSGEGIFSDSSLTPEAPTTSAFKAIYYRDGVADLDPTYVMLSTLGDLA